jgi:ABC-type dipeptide/oligopeptide/nickel transport system ATPase component
LKKIILRINNLTIFPKINSNLKLVKNISFDLPEGKTTCIVGESGSGKSLTALSIIKLLSSQLSLTGDIYFKNKNLSTISSNQMRSMRGKEISMIFQEPMTSLNPVLTIGFQIEESILVHNKLSKNQSKKRTEDLLELVGIDPDRYNSFPDELSGGQRQRVMIAMAMSCDPSLLIADEPTTALDVTVQAQVLKLLNSLKKKKQMTMLFITHDFGVVNDIADEVIVMFKGNIVEQGSVGKVLKNPKHPYTKALMRCVPDIHGRKKIQPIDYRKLEKEMASL